jgi:lipopolysaccharide export system permease protein
LTRSHELVVVRAAGLSAWQFLLPALALTLVIGACKIMLFNPFAAAMLERSNSMIAERVDGRSSLSAVSTSGLWLRQSDAAGDQAVVHAVRVNADSMQLRRVTIYQFHGDDEFVRRIDASTAKLSNGYWELENGWVTGPSKPGERIDLYRVPTDLTVERIVESFATPETVNFWQLPRFIAVLEATGLSSLPHRLHWHALLAEPLLLVAMILIAATFSLRLSRRGGTPALVVSGILAGFLLYLMTNVVHALGLGASLPVILAAWTPAGVSLTLGTAMVLHLEDG